MAPPGWEELDTSLAHLCIAKHPQTISDVQWTHNVAIVAVWGTFSFALISFALGVLFIATFYVCVERIVAPFSRRGYYGKVLISLRE